MKIFKQSSIKIDNIYFDPYMIDESLNDSKYIFITHSHYDHFSMEDINWVVNDETKFICPKDVSDSLIQSGIDENKILTVKPGKNYEIDDLKFSTTFAYNINKDYHPKNNNWVGYLIDLNDTLYYIAGDTDDVIENNNIKCDIAFIPIGGKYTMNYKEAAIFVNKIKPKKVVPIHYGIIVGDVSLNEEFKNLVNNDIEVEIIKCY